MTACGGISPEAVPREAAGAGRAEQARTLATLEERPQLAGSEDESLEDDAMLIRVKGNGHTVVFELNDSPASRSLYDLIAVKHPG